MTPLSVQGLSLERLAAFLVVFEAGGLARAAPGNAVKQSQLSRQLKDLEVALGQRLFLRTPQGLTATPAGRALARVVRELQQGLGDVAASSAGPTYVSLGAGDSVLQWLVLPRLAELKKGLVNTELEVTALGAEFAVSFLQEARIDLALLRGSEATGDLKTVRLGRMHYALFSAVGRKGLPLAVPTSEGGLRSAIAALGPVALRCETFPQVMQAVRSGAYAGLLPTFVREQLPASDFRATSHPALEAVSTPLILAWRARTLLRSPQVKALRGELELIVRRALRHAG